MLDFKLAQPQQEAQQDADSGPDNQVYDLIIIGGGPAGLTAAIYAGRARVKTLLLTGSLPGGQTANTDIVENYPGFPAGIEGPELAQKFQEQAGRFGAQIVVDNVTEVNFSTRPFTVLTHGTAYQAQTVIVAAGAEPRRLGVPGEEKFFGRGVSACATCDGFFYRDKRVVVVGGGDSAITEAIFLTRFASEVIVIHRRDELRATKINREHALANPKIRFVWDSVVEEILGEQTVNSVRVRNVKTGGTSVIETDGVFLYVGMKPVTELFAGQLELNEQGYIVSDQRQRTNMPGVFVAGDVQDPLYRQVVIAAGSGAVAAIEAERFLEQHSQP
ncbi:MAG: thioredoxin-disulfide reductase [Chloroflexi bacterium]|nr:MAG: thioredoxin-disulfide reductase [Anaerolineaceae bacterium 4572_32.2]RLC76783.1 MAG: thioredoxin-disulfide reductase [Chloroflexota bacterium]RLC87396.1 MAG: thioredoxin-disulfide reductase [Chloroflexota bacterium]HEY72272.1 thioredoxin-disulfide reductase [Thermoflexia bacterium]